jgi:NADH:ubiquinone oxidoreductase subunit 2 (subunit N)
MTPRQETAAAPRADVRRRRSNVLFVLVVTTACTLFLAATTSSTVMIYVFALAFLALCGYVFLLAQARQRSSSEWGDGWLDQR